MCLSKCLYWSYKQLFCCKRRIVKALFQEDEPRKKLWIEIPPPKHPWKYIWAVEEDGRESSVTEIVEEEVKEGETLTPERLAEMTGMNAVRWLYIDIDTYEEHEITSEGLVNVVKPKAD